MTLLRKHSTVTGDTHAASLDTAGFNKATIVGDNDIVAAGNIQTSQDLPADTNENTVITLTALAVPATPNRVILVCQGIVQKATNAGTMTVRIKNSTTELASVTTGSLTSAGDDAALINLTHAITDETAGNQTYSVTVQTSTAGGTVALFLAAYAVGGELTGSQGTCTP